MPNLGPTELIIVLVLVVIVFGVGKLPEVGGALGKSIKEFRKASDEPSAEDRAKQEEAGPGRDMSGACARKRFSARSPDACSPSARPPRQKRLHARTEPGAILDTRPLSRRPVLGRPAFSVR